MKRALLAAAALVLVFPRAAAAQEDADRWLTLDLYLEMESVSDPQIAPDGSQIIYTRSWIDKLNDRRESALWIMNADGSKNRFLTDGSSARWSPDGTRIAYLARGEPKGTQIFVRWMDAEGATTQITRVEETPSSIRWSPDGRHIAFTMLVPQRDTWTVKLPRRPEGAKWTEGPRIIDRLNYRRDRVGFLEDGYRHIFVVPADGGTPRQLTSGDYDHGGGFGSGIDWSPDGQAIVFSGLREEDADYIWRESEIYEVSVADGTIKQLTERRGPDASPAISPNGRLIAYTGHDFTDDTYIDSKLYVMNRDGSNPRLLAADLDRTPRNLIWSGDSRTIYFNIDSEGTRNLYAATLDGRVQKVTDGTHMLSVSDIDRNGQAVGVLTTYHEPGDVVSFNLRRPNRITQLTFVNDDILNQIELGEVEEIWYTSVDDLRIQGWIVKPPDFDPNKKYPLILQIHGGPHAMYNVGFSFSQQEHAASGYVVLYTNPRGSSGYGSAFGNAIKRAYPDKDFDDLMKGVDEVIARGYIDERNMFVYGGSGGGVLTAWVVGHTDRFAAASSNYPVIDWLSFVGTTDGAGWYRNFDRFPWEDPSEHLRRSPLMYAENVKTPTMLMTGVNDLRTPISQTEEFYMALKVQKVPTVMLRFNDEWHGTSSRPSNFMRSQLYLRSWFEKYTTTEQEPVAATGEKTQ
ncbi:MAG: peptidase S9 [Gemmatimonas sp. SM23_52]|nr:MAG: peptidase S9 [Gemmatimonas sp. SM23_52]